VDAVVQSKYQLCSMIHFINSFSVNITNVLAKNWNDLFKNWFF